MEGRPDHAVPYNIEAERSVLGSIMTHRDAIISVAPWLKPEDFYRETHAWTYEAQMDCYNRREPPDLVTVAAELERRGRLEAVGGAVYLSSLVDAAPTPVHIEYYGHIVERCSVLRRLIQAGGEIAAIGYEASDDVEDSLSRAEEAVFAISQRRVTRDFVPLRDITSEYFDRLSHLRATHSGLTGVPTGLRDLDDLLSGLQPSDLVVLAARPSVGKSSLALTIAHNAAQLNSAVGIFTLEMSREQLVQRLIAIETNVDSHRLREGRLDDDEFQLVSEAMARLSEMPIYIDDSPGLTVGELRSKARRLHTEADIDLVVIDYLQLMTGKRAENRVQEVSDITRGLKALARELNVPVLALSQLSRAVEQRTPHIPVLADLRESGCLAGDSLVYLPESGRRAPIRDLVGQSGFQVLGINTETCKVEPATVSRAFSTGVKPVFRLTTRLGRSIRATANHKFLTIEGWKRLDELYVGEAIALPRALPGPTEQTMRNAELALLGHLIGDGCTLPRHAIQYTTREKDLAETVASLARHVFGDKVAPRINPERNWYQVYLPASYHMTHGVHNPVVEWLTELGAFGLRSYEKRVPARVFEQPPAAIATFLRHLWATDGCIHGGGGKHQPVIYYATSSPGLARDIQTLLLRLGLNAQLRRVPQAGKGRDQYHVTLRTRPEMQRFLELVGPLGEYRKERRDEVLEHFRNAPRPARSSGDMIPHHIWTRYAIPAMKRNRITSRAIQARLGNHYCGTKIYGQNLSRERAARLARATGAEEIRLLAESDVYWDEVKSIEAAGEEEVFDLTVETLHSFVADDYYVHNSVEQDSDVVMFIYREAMYDQEIDEKKKHIAEIHVAKHRNGPIGKVMLYFDEGTTHFRDLDMRYEGEMG